MPSIEQRISDNADALISLGKAAWLKKRKAAHKQNMSDEQQEAELLEIIIDATFFYLYNLFIN